MSDRLAKLEDVVKPEYQPTVTIVGIVVAGVVAVIASWTYLMSEAQSAMKATAQQVVASEISSVKDEIASLAAEQRGVGKRIADVEKWRDSVDKKLEVIRDEQAEMKADVKYLVRKAQ